MPKKPKKAKNIENAAALDAELSENEVSASDQAAEMAEDSKAMMGSKRAMTDDEILEDSELLADSETSEDLDSEESEELETSEEAELMGAASEISESDDEASFLPEESDEDSIEATETSSVDVEGTELDAFESAEIEETEFVEDERLESIVESVLFASDRPVSLGQLKMVFKGTNIKTDKIKRALNNLMVEYAGARRGVALDEVPGGWQLRTKIDNLEFLRRTLKTRSFRLSGPALEVLSIVAYKQPLVKHEIDEIRGVESGHLLRALMEKNLVAFEGKSDLPGRPMQYGTTRKFLEIFSLRNLKELPTLSQIDELLPEGIDEEAANKPKLADITDGLVASVDTSSYSTGEEELQKIQDQLEQISTSSDFFEKEKLRQKEQRDRDKAQNIRDAMAVGETVSTRDMNWLKRYDEALANGTTMAATESALSAAGGMAAASAPVGVEDQGAGAMAGSTSALIGEQISEDFIDDDEPSLFEEEAPHIEDELPYEGDAEGEEGEGHAGL